uniref:Phospholipase A2-like central domain-containing protein n=1 Tax=Gouania willdenowi TaxID=441366 RepID=A0A8C5HXB3_GOUWI
VKTQIFGHADYGCYFYLVSFNIFSICLLGLKVHDQCYSDAIQNPDCWPFVDNPYLYSYDQKNRKVTCGSANDKCGMLICECDRKAAECFCLITSETRKTPSLRVILNGLITQV